MKFFGKLFITVVVIIALSISGGWFLIQTHWGATKISAWISRQSDYRISFDKINYDWSSPGKVILNNVIAGRKGQPTMLTAKCVDVILSPRQFSSPWYVKSITLHHGSLNLNSPAATPPLKADILQLDDMSISHVQGGKDLHIEQLKGGIKPWIPHDSNPLSNDAEIQFSAEKLTLNGITANHVLLQGSVKNQTIILNTIGADIARGSLTGSAQRNNDGSWQINSLLLSNIRLESSQTLHGFLALPDSASTLRINSMEVTDAQLEGKQWAISDLNLSLRNLSLEKGSWQSKEGRLSLSASEFINGTLHLHDPIANVDFSPSGVALRKFTSRWQDGVVRASGSWQHKTNSLTLDDVAIVGLEYTLPQNWKTRWMSPLPAWLDSVTIGKLSASRNLIIDINPDFPFQITSLDGTASNLQLVRQHQWGIWQGDVSLNAAAATFNRVDVRRPSVRLSATEEKIAINELSAFAGKGLLEANASILQSLQRQTQLDLTGKAVPLNILQMWGWPVSLPEEDGNLQLSATGNLEASRALKPTVNAILQMTDTAGQHSQQILENGEIPGT